MGQQMRPGGAGRGKGFGLLARAAAGSGVSVSALLMAAPALAASPAIPAGFSTDLLNAAPLAIAGGALAFAGISAVLLNKWRRRARQAEAQSGRQLAQMRATLDEYEALLAVLPEVTLVWDEGEARPRLMGDPAMLLGDARWATDLTDLDRWLPASAAAALSDALGALRAGGQRFDLSLVTRGGRLIRAFGRMLGTTMVVRLRPAMTQPGQAEPAAQPLGDVADLASARSIFGLLSKPAFLRDVAGRLIYANPAYLKLAQKLGQRMEAGQAPDLVPAEMQARVSAAVRQAQPGSAVTIEQALNVEGGFDLVAFAVSGGTAGYLRPRAQPGAPALPAPDLSHPLGRITDVIDALSTPIAIFDARRHLLYFNRAYAAFWGLDPDWLASGLDERAILDRLRTQGLLPAEPDYRAWRAEHLSAYQAKATRETRWHLPNGTTLNVVAAPASAEGGVIYVFEDLTQQLALQSRTKALESVQRETINALSEGVAVFGTNGRLTLSNPRLSSLWKLPMNTLGQHPHIDEIAKAAAEAMPEDGAIIWRDIKRSIIDLNPTRTDRSGRISRADGRLLDYALVRLPDGQTLMTFVDVTESANYQRLLKERNDALVTADRIKDAFVQNVSYELRSPLTNIIGFADLLANGGAGPLTAQQKSYTDYIRASSATLGVLIDNILDLTTLDAGITELQLGVQDMAALVEKAQAGLAATFPAIDGVAPLQLEVEIEPDLPEFVADGTRIVQILYNLLSNAARFGAPGTPIKLTVAARGHDRILFIVEDEGAGIPEDMKAALFQRFEGQTVEGRQRGAGLGLSIVKTFVNLHGGTISVEDRQPRGTRVIVNLPAHAQTAATTASA